MKLMGYSDFNLHKNIIFQFLIKEKKLAMEKAYKSILEEEKALQNIKFKTGNKKLLKISKKMDFRYLNWRNSFISKIATNGAP